ncbi:uncharacterized protein LOC116297537 [Actinia tenebrosa]|uniref:Uncharacterized protein LOC116297537 n=1 Tax=Actinia tenebrosa TaxID=6105 RepID=A0A6P8HZ33_ACTTE|nr:uncharacterized protein LOC116297537 [Actinia tenebrosa]
MASVASSNVSDLVTRTEKLSIKCIASNTKILKTRITKLEKMYETMKQQQDDIQYLLDAVLKWDEDFKRVVRFSQGVPHMRGTKDTCSKIKTIMIPNGEFDRTIKILEKENVSGFARVVLLFADFKSLLDEKSPTAKFSETVRQTLGEIIGTLYTILNLFYDQ